MKFHIEYIAMRLGVEYNEKMDINKVITEIFKHPLVQDYLDGKEEMNEDKVTQLFYEKYGVQFPKKDLDKILNNPKLLIEALSNEPEHGLFGKYNYKPFGNINLPSFNKYLEKKIDEGTITYQSLISFAPEDAEALGLTNQEGFQNLLKANIYKIAGAVGIPPSRLEFAGAVHLKESNPHIHFVFWDREQGVKEAFVHPNTSKQIREKLIKNVYKDQLNDLHLLKNSARDILTKNVTNDYKPVAEYLIEKSPEEYLRTKKKTRSIFFNTCFSAKEMAHINKELFRLLAKLPKSGSLKYDYLPPDLKEELQHFIKKMIAENPYYQYEFDNYVQTAVEIGKYYSHKPEKLAEIKENAEKEIIKRMSNKLLTELKKVKKYETNINHREEKLSAHDTLSILRNVFQLLQQENKKINNIQEDIRQDLSKQAKKELAKKLEYASDISWE